VRCVTTLQPDVVLLDVHMPGGGGLEVIRQVAALRPAQRFLALSVSDAAQDVIASSAQARAATSPRRSRAPSWPTRCAGCTTGTRSSPPGWPASSWTPSRAPSQPRPPISAKTVEAHVSAVLRKLQLSTRHELSRWAVERRLVD